MGTRIEGEPPADAMLRAMGLDHPADWESFAAGDGVNRSPRGFVRRFRWPERDGPFYYFKLYRLSRPWKAFRSAFRKDPAWRERANLSWLGRHGFPVPPVVAWGCHRRFRVVRACFLVTREEPGVVDLASIAAIPASPGPAPLRRRVLEGIGALAALVRRMHDAGFFAHDLHFRNVLVAPEALHDPSAPLHLALLDFPNGCVLPPGSQRRREAAVYDLASLDLDARLRLSRSDRLRFLRAYLGGPVDRELVDMIAARLALQLAKRAHQLSDQR